MKWLIFAVLVYFLARAFTKTQKVDKERILAPIRVENEKLKRENQILKNTINEMRDGR